MARRIAAASAGIMLAGLVSACNGTPGPLASGPMTAPVGTTLAVESIDGAPDTVRTALAGEIATAAGPRRVGLVQGSGASYRLRGYLAPERSAEGDTRLSYVWDVYDARNRLARRIAGSDPLGRAASEDPWSGFDRQAMRRLAETSMDEIAGFLAGDATGSGAVVASAEADLPDTAPASSLGFAAD